MIDTSKLEVLLLLKGIFQKDTYYLIQTDIDMRDKIVEILKQKSNVIYDMTTFYDREDLLVMAESTSELSFPECANFLIYYFRLLVSQGGRDNAIELWKNEKVLNVVERMIELLPKI